MTATVPPPAAEMTHLQNVGPLVEVAADSTASRTVLKADGARLVLFLLRHRSGTQRTAAMPVLLHVLDGRLTVTAPGRSIVHLTAGLPHAVIAREPGRPLLTTLDPRAHA